MILFPPLQQLENTVCMWSFIKITENEINKKFSAPCHESHFSGPHVARECNTGKHRQRSPHHRKLYEIALILQGPSRWWPTGARCFAWAFLPSLFVPCLVPQSWPLESCKPLSQARLSWGRGGRRGVAGQHGELPGQACPDSSPVTGPSSDHPPAPGVRLSRPRMHRFCRQPSKHRLLTDGVVTLSNVTQRWWEKKAFRMSSFEQRFASTLRKDLWCFSFCFHR